MNHVMVVLPSSLAATRLQQLLATTAHEQELLLRPPQVLTFGDLPEKLYKAKFPFASELQQTLAWIEALKSLSASELSPLLVQPPDSEQSESWMELAGMLSSLHRELSSDLTMFSDVIELLDDDSDEKRWEVLAKLQNRYLDRLSDQKLWDIQTSRRFAVEWNEVAMPDEGEVVMLGTVDLNRAQRYFLDIIGPAVTILIGAPQSWEDGFDPYGALISDYWQDVCIDISSRVLVSRSTADEVAESVASFIGEFSSSYSAQEITVGLPEPDIMPPLVERLQRSGVASRQAAGVVATQTKYMRLLQIACDFVTSGRFDDFAALVRIPAVERLIRADKEVPETYISALDAYYRKTLISSVRVADIPNKESSATFERVLAVVDGWLKPLRMDRVPLPDWARAIRQVLQGVVGPHEVNLEDSHESMDFRALTLLANVLTQLEDLQDGEALIVTLTEAMAWIARELEPERVVPLNDPKAIELLGWLELSLDDAPVLLLTGVHDGRVPESVNGDPFLPNGVRSRLGLMDNARRYARDCYALQVMLHSREQMRILTNHYDSEGSPQTPSRLLLAVQPDELADRIVSILKPVESQPKYTLQRSWIPIAGQTWLPVPLPDPELGQKLESFTATDFADYLYCPYRFYLKKLCKVRQVNDNVYELEANTFGDLIHNCVMTLKDSPVQDSGDADQIRKFLFAQLRVDAEKMFGKIPAPAVRVQIEQARLRLAKFAELQAERNRAGWRIWGTEIDVKREYGVSIEVDGHTVTFHGRIDRIDYHAARDTYAVLDYKTSDNPKKPVAAHCAAGKWKQLQLPLYRHLVKGLGIERLESVGYINLPKAVDHVAFEIADFDAQMLEQADKKIIEVVRSVRNGIFWPPSYDDVFNSDEFLPITQHNTARRWEPTEHIEQVLRTGVDAVDDELETVRSGERTDAIEKVAKVVRRVPASNLVSTRLASSKPERITPLLDNTTGKVPSSWYSSKLIRASAGSGKTYQLAQRVIQLLFAGESVDSILATTFTRKAAGEILERVLTFIADAVLDKSSFERLRQMVKPRTITLQSCKYHLARLCSDLHRLRISTLDSFYNELARNFSLELSLPPGWRLADPYEERKLQSIAIGRMFSMIDQEQMHSLISQLCKGEAIRGVWREIASTIEAGYPIYLSTERQSWMQSFVQGVPSEQRITAAIDAIGASDCGDKRYAASRDRLIQLFLGADRSEFLSHLLVERARQGEMHFSKKEIYPDVSDEILALVSAALNEEFRILEQQNASAYELLSNFHTQLDHAKRRERILTFADVSLRLSSWMQKKMTAVTAAKTESNGESNNVDLMPIHQRLDSAIKHLLLDEFQDTSPAQWKILQPFAMDVFVTDSLKQQKSSIFCVGDVKQAIYGWRGGVAELFELISRQLSGIQDETLEKSYRSSPVVIDFVNAVFAGLDSHKNYGQGKDAIVFWNKGFKPHLTEKSELPGYVQIYNGFGKRLSDQSSEEDSEAEDPTLFERCVNDIADLTAVAPKKSIGVLVRTNAEVTHMINLLREQSIDASQEGGNPLTDSAPVDLILSLIALADHPGDGIAYFHVTNASPKSFLEQLPKPLSPASLSTWIRQQFDRDGYADAISQFASQISVVCNERDQLRLEQLIQLAYQYERIETPRLRDFIDYVQTQKISLPKVAAVRVMTIHQAKGLEFDAVFLPNLSRRFVNRQSTFVVKAADTVSDPDGVTRRVGGYLQQYLSKEWQLAFDKDAVGRLQDSLCNFYVAITRARQALYVYAAPSKNELQQWDSVLHSIFAPGSRDQADEMIYHSGTPDWYRDRDEPAWPQTLFPLDDIREDVASIPEIALHEDFFESDSVRKVRHLPGLRPSLASEARHVKLQKALEPAATFGTVAGTVVHRWFEDIRWINEYQFSRDRERQLALDVLTPEQMPLIHIDDWIDRFERYLENPGVREVLSKEQYRLDEVRAATGRNLGLSIHNERRILELVDGTLLKGTIDRLVLVEDDSYVVAAEIIDYKTDFFELFQRGANLEEWIELKKMRHRQQLMMYRDSISRMYQLPKERIAMTLMLLSADVVVNIED